MVVSFIWLHPFQLTCNLRCHLQITCKVTPKMVVATGSQKLFFSVLTSFTAFFFYLGFFQEHSRITGLQGKGEGISFTPHCHFHPLHRHLDIDGAITAESLPLHIASGRALFGTLDYSSEARYIIRWILHESKNH